MAAGTNGHNEKTWPVAEKSAAPIVAESVAKTKRSD